MFRARGSYLGWGAHLGPEDAHLGPGVHIMGQEVHV